MNLLIHAWKTSRFRFYFLNFKWNISFWLNAKRVYKVNTYKKVKDYYYDFTNKMHPVYETISKKRFAGYIYKGVIYLDNPGMPIKERYIWKAWKDKGLI